LRVRNRRFGPSLSTFCAVALTLTRGCSSGSPAPISENRIETIGSTSILRVCTARREIRMMGAPSMSVAVDTSEA
jgi:hypothetical protein